MFQSALAQAEELWDAASTATPLSRPLPLFYSLNQAAFAICAVWTPQGEWRPRGHGMAIEDPPASGPLRASISLSDDVLGTFGMLARATESPRFEGKTTVADLWASLPPLPLAAAVTEGALPWLALRAMPPSSGTLNQGVFVDLEFDELETVLKDYPTTYGWESYGSRVGTVHTEQVVIFRGEKGRLRPLTDVAERLDGDSPYWFDGRFAVRPRLGSGEDPPPSRLLTLWALLFALSYLARYHSDRWVALLAPDRSIAAVPLEEGLAVALDLVPALVLDAVTGGSFRLH